MLHRKLLKAVLIACCALGSTSALAQMAHRQVAITIDDLPYADGRSCDEKETSENTKKLLDPIRAAKVPVVGFVIGERCRNLTPEQRRDLLKMWLDAGAELGNHTWSHPDLNRVSLEEYEKQILKTDDDLHHTISPLKVRYFRAPYLHDGATPEIKEQLQSFLMQHGYQEASLLGSWSETGFEEMRNVSEVRRKLNSPTGLGSQGAVVRLPRLIVEGSEAGLLVWSRSATQGRGAKSTIIDSYTEVLAPRAA